MTYIVGAALGVALCELSMPQDYYNQDSKVLYGFVLEVWPMRKARKF